MKIKPLYIILPSIALLGSAGVWLFLQYRKITNYTIKMKRIKLNSISLNKTDFDLYIAFDNKSDLKFEITSISTDVYMNGKYLTKVQNFSKIRINPGPDNLISVNIEFNTTDALNIINSNYGDLISHQDKITLKMDNKIGVSLYGIPVHIPFVYETTLKDMLTN